MKIVYNGNNCTFLIDDKGDCHCFSYTSEVAAIINGEYIEYDGPMYYSRTSNKHKSMFRTHFDVKENRNDV